MKTCTKCSKEKPLDQFGKNGVSNGKQKHRPACKDCVSANPIRYSEQVIEKRRAYDRQYLADNREKKKQYLKQYRLDNPEYFKQYRSDNQEVRQTQSKQWREDNPDKVREMRSRYRARKRDLFWHDVPDQHLIERDGLFCGWCSKVLPEDLSGVHRDHIMPLSFGGPHTHNNLTLACSNCNLRKKDKDPLEFALEAIKPSSFVLDQLEWLRMFRYSDNDIWVENTLAPVS